MLVSCMPEVTVIPTEMAVIPTVTLKSVPSPTVPQTNKTTTGTYPTRVYGVLFSPDGKKRIQSSDWKTFEILNADGTIIWSFSYDDKKFGKDKAALLSEAGYSPFYWSQDGKYIYITCFHGNDDGSTKYIGNTFIDGDGVFRFDVDTGKMIEIIPEILPGYYAFSISPDGNQLVYANQTETPVKIKLLDLSNNQEKVLLTADEKILEIGSFGWSPKKDKLLFTTLELLDEQKRIYSIFVLDLNSVTTQSVVENIDQRLDFESWNERGQILYNDMYHTGWQLDLESKSLSRIATATPIP